MGERAGLLVKLGPLDSDTCGFKSTLGHLETVSLCGKTSALLSSEWKLSLIFNHVTQGLAQMVGVDAVVMTSWDLGRM